MTQSLLNTLSRFPNQRVVVIGDAILDSYLDGNADRLSREGPVPVVQLSSRRDCAGGAANVALNLAALGAQVDLVSVIGADDAGRSLHRLLHDGGVRTGLMIDSGRATPWLQRIRAGGHLIARVDQRSPRTIDEATGREVGERLRAVLPQVSVIVLSDYEGGVVNDAVVELIGKHRSEATVVVDAKHPARYRHLHPTAVTPNWDEALPLLGPVAVESSPQPDIDRVGFVQSRWRAVLAATGAQLAAVTLDRDGALLCEQGKTPHRTFATAVDDSQAAGAGDTFLAALALALGTGADTATAADLAAAAANLVVTQPGTVACWAEDLEAQLLGTAKVVTDGARLQRLVARLHASGRRIVFTNGCFDLLHPGHISYLNAAKDLGDVLLVAMNSDHSVRSLKGPDRPINRLEDRMAVLTALSCVDYILPFDSPSPERLLELVRPHTYAKGGDYTRATLPETPLLDAMGTKIEFLPLVNDTSTTALINRIQRQPA